MKTQEKIQLLLGWNSQNYADAVFKTGIYYIERESPKWAAELILTKAFWNAFKKQYSILDEWFLTETKPYTETWSKLLMVDYYTEFHGKMGMNANAVDKDYWNCFYSEMVGFALKEIKLLKTLKND